MPKSSQAPSERTRLVIFKGGRQDPWETEECGAWEARSGDVAAASFSLPEFSGSEDFVRARRHTPLRLPSRLPPALPSPAPSSPRRCSGLLGDQRGCCVRDFLWKGRAAFGFDFGHFARWKELSGREKEPEPVTELGSATLRTANARICPMR